MSLIQINIKPQIVTICEALAVSGVSGQHESLHRPVGATARL